MCPEILSPEELVMCLNQDGKCLNRDRKLVQYRSSKLLRNIYYKHIKLFHRNIWTHRCVVVERALDLIRDDCLNDDDFSYFEPKIRSRLTEAEANLFKFPEDMGEDDVVVDGGEEEEIGNNGDEGDGEDMEESDVDVGEEEERVNDGSEEREEAEEDELSWSIEIYYDEDWHDMSNKRKRLIKNTINGLRNINKGLYEHRREENTTDYSRYCAFRCLLDCILEHTIQIALVRIEFTHEDERNEVNRVKKVIKALRMKTKIKKQVQVFELLYDYRHSDIRT